MKRVSRRVRNKFMRALLSAASESSTRSVKPGHPALAELHKRDDYEHVMSVLEGLGLITFERPNGVTFMWYKVTREGNCYFEKQADERYRLIVNSIILPILVAIITTTVTVYILPALGQSAKQWLSQVSQNTPVSPEPILPTCAPSENPEFPPVYPEQTPEAVESPS